MIAGFSGTSKHIILPQCLELLDEMRDYDIHELHLGDCIGGDHQAYVIAKHIGNIKLVGHPPDNPKKRANLKYDRLYPEAPYLVRNHRIVDWVNSKSGIMFIGPATFEEELRSGTWATYRFAKEVGCAIHVLHRGLVAKEPGKFPWIEKG